MRFIVDASTGPAVADWLHQEGHDVVSVYEPGGRSIDEDILSRAVAEDPVLITNDKDFGALLFSEGKPRKGVVLLRLRDEGAANKVRALDALLTQHANRLPGNFIVVDDDTARVTRHDGR